LPSPDPLPTLATWFAGPPVELVVTFDRPLVPGPLDVGNWYAVYATKDYNFSAGQSLGSNVYLTPAIIGAAPGGNRVSFRPPPFDVQTPQGGHAAAFEDFPIA